MSTENHARRTDSDFFPANVEFLGFIGGWDSYIGVDTVHTLFYLIRTKDLDWLEEVAKYSNTIVGRHCVISVQRDGSSREAAARLLDAHVRSRVHYEWPVPPYQSGLLSTDELKTIVGAVAEDLNRNSQLAEEQQRRHESPIIKMARELGLEPRPAGHNDTAWMAGCPRSRNHWIMISPSVNEFGCGYCRRKGGPSDLWAFYEDIHGRGGRP